MGDFLEWVKAAFITYVLHPLKGNGYQFWSGIGSDLGEITLVGLILAWVKHHNCHHKGCIWLGHPHPEHGRPTCKRHYSEPFS